MLLLEKGSARFSGLAEELGQAVVRGDAVPEARTMEEVGASRADVVIAVTGENRTIWSFARWQNNISMLGDARLNNPKHEQIFQKLGIDITVSPNALNPLVDRGRIARYHICLADDPQKSGLANLEMRVPVDFPIVGKTLGTINLPRTGNSP